MNTKYTNILFPVKNIVTREQLENLSTLAMQELPTFLKEIQLRPGILASSPDEDVLMPSVVNSSTIAVSPGVGVTNQGNIVELEEEARVTGVNLGAYIDQTLFIEYKEILTSDITTIHKITGNDTNVSYVKDQTISAFSWKSGYDPTTDEDDKIPLGQLKQDADGSFYFKKDDGYRRIFLLDIRFIEEGHYSGEFTKSVDQFTTLYNLLACKGHAPRATNNPSGMSTRDISHGIETFAALIDTPGIPARDFIYDIHKDYLKVEQGTNAGTIKVLAGEFIDVNGRRVIIPTDQDNIAVPADSNTYNVWIVYTTDANDEDSFDITVSQADSLIALKCAEVVNNGLTVIITDTRTTLKCRSIIQHYIPPDATHVRAESGIEQYNSSTRVTGSGKSKSLNQKFGYIHVKWGDEGKGSWAGNVFAKSSSEQSWINGEWTPIDSYHDSWYLYDKELDEMYRIIGNTTNAITVFGSGAIGIGHDFRILMDVDRYEIIATPEVTGDGGVKRYDPGEQQGFGNYGTSPPMNEVILRHLDLETKYKVTIKAVKGIYYNEPINIEISTPKVTPVDDPTNLILTTGLEDQYRNQPLGGHMIQFTGKAWIKAEWDAVEDATGYVVRLKALDPGTKKVVNIKESGNIGISSEPLTERTWHGLETNVEYEVEVAALGQWGAEDMSGFISDTIEAGNYGKEFGKVTVPVDCSDIFNSALIAVTPQIDGTILTTPLRAEVADEVGSIEVIYTESAADADPPAPDFGSTTQPFFILPPDGRNVKIPILYGRKGKVGIRARDKSGKICVVPIQKTFSSIIPTLDNIEDGLVYKRVDGLKVGNIDDLLTAAGTKSLISERMNVATATDGTLTNKLQKTIRCESTDCNIGEYFDRFRFPEDVKIWGMSIFSIQSANAANGDISICYNPLAAEIVACSTPDDQLKSSAVAVTPTVVTGGISGEDIYIKRKTVVNAYIVMVTIYYEFMAGGSDVETGGI